MNPIISVIICTHNPRPDYISRVLEALKYQTLPIEQWELLLVDNASHQLLSSEIDLSWHPNARHIREEKLGLTAARLRGFQEAVAEIFVFADDDNVLAPDYLKNVVNICVNYPKLGAWGGKTIPEYEIKPESWISEIDGLLGLRDFGDDLKVCYWEETSIQSFNLAKQLKQYPDCSPIGAGLILRREAAEFYVQQVTGSSTRLAFGRTGKQLISGEDNDIVLTVLEGGWGVGYFPQLQLTHLIPSSRLSKNYLAKLNRAMSRSWIQVLDTHKIRPWLKIPRWTVLPRKIKAFFRYKPWKYPASYIRWQGACGTFEGLGELTNHKSVN
ncbi:glycosyltransferase [Lyngbya aestuarii]|uniref:glycosyltransferase n=1 Tax=Lyngbya aestuarii TaxID=118322 RepID=UPI00058EF6AB|nr:glycosyltransferase [Lyngbya aestuarii]